MYLSCATQAMVCAELKKYGLRYDDLLDPFYSNVGEPSHTSTLP